MPFSTGLLHLCALELAAAGHFALLSKISQENESLQSCYRYVCLSTSSKFERKMKMVRRHVSIYAEGQERTLGGVLMGGRKKPLNLAWAVGHEGILQQHLLCEHEEYYWKRDQWDYKQRMSSRFWSSSLLETQPFTSLQIPLAFSYCDVQTASEYQHLA